MPDITVVTVAKLIAHCMSLLHMTSKSQIKVGNMQLSHAQHPVSFISTYLLQCIQIGHVTCRSLLMAAR